MLSRSTFRKLILLGSPILVTLYSNNAHAANLTVESSFVQPYGNYLLTGHFSGSDNDNDGLLIRQELMTFSLFFNHGETPISQNLSQLTNFSYTIGSDTVTQIVSNSMQTIEDGTIASIDYRINAFTPSLIAEQSSISLTTYFSDDRQEEEISFLSNSPIAVGEVVPQNTIPESSNVIALVVLGGTIVSLKSLKK